MIATMTYSQLLTRPLKGSAWFYATAFLPVASGRRRARALTPFVLSAAAAVEVSPAATMR